MKHKFLSLRAIIIYLFSIAIIQAGCKENTILNSKISPSGNQIGIYQVSLPCITHTYYDNGTITSTNIGGIPIEQAVGSYSDPFFGTMTAATFFQIIFTDPGPSIFTGDSIDSAVLIMPYSGFTYGAGTTVPATPVTQTYQVFYMLDTMSINSNYYETSNKPVDIYTPLSDPYTANITNLPDSFSLYPNVLPQNYPGLRIPLKLPVVKSRLLAAQAATTSSNPAQDFLNNFNGICVRVADTRTFNTVMPYFQLDGATVFSQAGILLYYHATTDPTTALVEPYYFNTGYCAHFNSITKSFSHSPVNALFHSTAANDQIIALQNQPGASFDIVIPGIRNLPAGIINKAELQLTVLPGYGNADSLLPEKLYPLGISTGIYPSGVGAGLAYTLADRYPLTSISPLIVMDGYVHNIPAGGTTQVFTIDLPREVLTSIAAHNDTLHLHINGTEDFYGAFHLVVGGGAYGVNGTADTIYRPRLNIVYSKLQ